MFFLTLIFHFNQYLLIFHKSKLIIKTNTKLYIELKQFSYSKIYQEDVKNLLRTFEAKNTHNFKKMKARRLVLIKEISNQSAYSR